MPTATDTTALRGGRRAWVCAELADVSTRRFLGPFRLQVAVVLATILGLTGAHFVLAAGGLSWLQTNLLFVFGMALAALVLIKSTRFAEGESQRSFQELQRSYLGSVGALSTALNACDGYTADHTDDVEKLATAVARRLGMTKHELEALRYGALFHDIGKIGVPDSILNKPSPLTPEEWEIMKRHPVIGEQILAPLGFLDGVLPIVRHDHERWDGSGYPDGLAGEDIPLGARIVLVCDAYNAMTSDRPYRDALPRAEAIQRLRQGIGTQFDPGVVEAFRQVLTDGASAGALGPVESIRIGEPETGRRVAGTARA